MKTSNIFALAYSHKWYDSITLVIVFTLDIRQLHKVHTCDAFCE